MSNIHKHQHIAASMLQGPCSRVTALRGSRLGRICHLAKALAAVKAACHMAEGHCIACLHTCIMAACMGLRPPLPAVPGAARPLPT